MPTKVGLKSAQGHVILLVGYNSQKKRFIYRNRGGKGWGNNGYGKIKEQYIVDHCEVCMKLCNIENDKIERRKMILKDS